MTMSPARSLVFGIARRVPSPNSPRLFTEHVGRLWICKMIFTYPSINLICWKSSYVVPLHRGLVQHEPAFLAPPRLALRGGFIGTSCKSRDRVPLITGSFINMGVCDPTTTVGMTLCILDKSQVVMPRTLDILPLYKGVEAYASFPPLLLLLAPQAPALKT